MAFEKRSIRTSVLIRWHEDGRIGAQENGIDQVLEDGVVFSAKETDPVQLGTGDFPGSIPLKTVLGDATLKALAAQDAALAARDQALAIQDQALDQLGEVTDQLEQANKELESVRGYLKSALEEIDRLNSAIPLSE